MLSAFLLGATLAVQPAINLDTQQVPRTSAPPPLQINMTNAPVSSERVDVKAVGGDRLLFNNTVRVEYSRPAATRSAADLLGYMCERSKDRGGLKLVLAPLRRNDERFRVAASWRSDGSCAPTAQLVSLDQVVKLERGKPVTVESADGLKLELRLR